VVSVTDPYGRILGFLDRSLDNIQQEMVPLILSTRHKHWPLYRPRRRGVLANDSDSGARPKDRKAEDGR
jgi:hypothetical protein